MANSNWQAAEEDALFDENEEFNLDKYVSQLYIKFHIFIGVALLFSGFE